MLNEDIIKNFVETNHFDATEESQKRYLYALEKIVSFEENINKPFEKFTTDDFVELFNRNNWCSYTTFHSNKAVIKEFAEWYYQK